MPQESKPSAEAIPPDPFAGLAPGRIVLYAPTGTEARYANDPGPWPAMVTKVGVGGKVTLNVNLPSPIAIGADPVQRRSEVPYGAPLDSAPGSGFWSWPPKS